MEDRRKDFPFVELCTKVLSKDPCFPDQFLYDRITAGGIVLYDEYCAGAKVWWPCGCTGDRIAGKQQWAGIAVWCFRTLGEE